jgi:DNA-binding MarR family transcriptional regulator
VLASIFEFTQLVAASATSARQKERVLRAARVPVTGAGLTALRAVERYEPVTVSELARRVGVDLSTVSRQLRPLEDEDLVTRSTDARDGRVARVALSTKGRRVLGRVTDAVLADFDAALAGWPAADRTRLATLLDRFRDRLAELRAEEAAAASGGGTGAGRLGGRSGMGGGGSR